MGSFDDYLTAIPQGYSAAFVKQDNSDTNLLGESFDYTSVMMYDELAFSKVCVYMILHNF
jgi:hypothetical protein